MTRLTLLWQRTKDNYLVFHWHQQIYLKIIIDAYNEEIFSIPDYAAPPCMCYQRALDSVTAARRKTQHTHDTSYTVYLGRYITLCVIKVTITQELKYPIWMWYSQLLILQFAIRLQKVASIICNRASFEVYPLRIHVWNLYLMASMYFLHLRTTITRRSFFNFTRFPQIVCEVLKTDYVSKQEQLLLPRKT